MPNNLYLIGLPGSGKTTLGAALAEALRRPFADLDAWIEGRVGLPIPQIFAERGEPAFRDEESAALLAATKESGLVIATGGGIVLRPENVALMRESGNIIWLDRPVERIIGDIRPGGRPLLAGDAARRLRELAAQRNDLYAQAADARLANDSAPQAALAAALALVAQCAW